MARVEKILDETYGDASVTEFSRRPGRYENDINVLLTILTDMGVGWMEVGPREIDRIEQEAKLAGQSA